MYRKEDLGKRLQNFFMGHKQHGVAKQVKIPQPTLNGLINGKVFPSVPSIQSLIRFTNIDIRWYLSGFANEETGLDGHYYIDQTREKAIAS